MTGLKRLQLRLRSSENTQKFLKGDNEFDEACISYDQVFSRTARWPHLSQLHIGGLAVHALDLYYLLYYQTPKLRRLTLHHIDLLTGRWEGVVEMLQRLCHWEQCTLQGTFRHQGGHWWPRHPQDELEERDTLQDINDSIVRGCEHPSLRPKYDSSLSSTSLKELCSSAGVDHVMAVKEGIRYLQCLG